MECGFESCLMKPVLFYGFTNFQCYLLNTLTDQCYILNSVNSTGIGRCSRNSTGFPSLQETASQASYRFRKQHCFFFYSFVSIVFVGFHGITNSQKTSLASIALGALSRLLPQPQRSALAKPQTRKKTKKQIQGKP